VQIDTDPGDQRHVQGVGAQHPRRARAQPCQRGAQAAMRERLGHRRPQRAGRQLAPPRAHRQRHIGQQALRRRRQPDRGDATRVREATEQQHPRAAG